MQTSQSLRKAVLAIAGLSVSGIAFAQPAAPIRLTGGAPGTARFITVPKNFINFKADLESPEAANVSTLPSWTGTSNGVTFTMLGADPSTGVSTTLPVVFVPLIFKIGTFTFDPTKPVNGGTESALRLMKQSPIFVPNDLKAGTVDLGANQWVDNFSRANFWTQTGAGANGYHVKLSAPTVKSPITLTVPASQGTTINTAVGPVGDVNINYFQNTLNAILANTKLGVNPSQFVIFVYYNTFFYQGNSNNCCILGFHGETAGLANNNGLIYSASAFNDGGIFSLPPGQFLQDVTVIAHEIGEAFDDPFISSNVNFVPPFGNVGQVSGCQNNLEDGDPVTGIAATVKMPNGFTYHPEDLVFHGWFTRETASTSVNGWYTLLNSFTGDAKPCPPGGSN